MDPLQTQNQIPESNKTADVPVSFQPEASSSEFVVTESTPAHQTEEQVFNPEVPIPKEVNTISPEPKAPESQFVVTEPTPAKRDIPLVVNPLIPRAPRVIEPVIPKDTKTKVPRVKTPLKITGKAPPMDMIFTLQNLAVMLKTGLPIEDALVVISEQAQSKTLRNTYLRVVADINSGLTLAAAMKKYPSVFSTLIVSIVNAGEQGGSLENNLSYLADYLKKNYALQKKIKAALFYPLIIITLTFVEIIGVVFFVLPQLDTFFSSLKTQSVITSVVLGFGRYVRSNGLILLIIFITMFVGLFFYFKTKSGRYTRDFLYLTVPIIRKLTLEVVLANFARTFGTLLESGIPMYNALSLSKETINNKIYEKALEDVQKKVLGGMSLSDSMKGKEHLFPIIFTKMLEVGEKAGALETNLLSMHQYYTSEAEELSNNFAVLVEPILLIVVGIIVGLLAVSIIVPLYSVVSGLHG